MTVTTVRTTPQIQQQQLTIESYQREIADLRSKLYAAESSWFYSWFSSQETINQLKQEIQEYETLLSAAIKARDLAIARFEESKRQLQYVESILSRTVNLLSRTTTGGAMGAGAGLGWSLLLGLGGPATGILVIAGGVLGARTCQSCQD